jgi:ABC-type uncharacterized transport system involved in gliding motility auxiliary subunit
MSKHWKGENTDMKNLTKQFITTFVTGAVLLTGIVIVVNMIFNNINLGRFDLTADRVYSVSPSVQKILSGLEAPIDITYYVSSSEKMPTQWKNLERDVIDLLKELKLASTGKLDYTVFDPSAEEEKEAFEEEKEQEEAAGTAGQPAVSRKRVAQRLKEKGVIPFGVQSAQRDEFAIKRVYSSLVLSYLDRKEDVIAEVRPETFGTLEYEIMSRIYRLISTRRPRIGFYPSQPEIPPQYRQMYRQAPPDMYSFVEKLLKESGYDVTRTNLTENDPIPEDIQTMIVMVDQPMNQRQLYELDKLVHNGVRLILAGQQYNFRVSPAQEPGRFLLQGMPSRLNINDLVRTYGVEIDNQILMDKNTAYVQVPVYQTRRMGAYQVQQQRFEPVTKPVMIRVETENLNSRFSISNKITELFYMFGTRLLIHEEILKENNIQQNTLFTSSSQSWVRTFLGTGLVDDSPPAPSEKLDRQPLGVFLEGRFPARFSEGTIPTWPGAASGEEGSDTTGVPTELGGEPAENKIIVFGCSNMFNDQILQSVVSHRALLLNSVDALTLGEDLIKIRSKTISARRIKATSSVGKTATKAFVLLFTPLVFVGLGIYLTVRRKLR